jgi:hypothetical protein
MDKIDELLTTLEDIAMSYSSYEFGLPLYDEGAKARMRALVDALLHSERQRIIAAIAAIANDLPAGASTYHQNGWKAALVAAIVAVRALD